MERMKLTVIVIYFKHFEENFKPANSIFNNFPANVSKSMLPQMEGIKLHISVVYF